MDKIRTGALLLLLIGVVGTILGLSPNVIDGAGQLAIHLFAGALASFLVGTLLEGLGLDSLRLIAVNVEIAGFHFSITAFALVTFLLRMFFF